jgi:hypothetical protein
MTTRKERPAIAPWISDLHGLRGQRLLDIAARPCSGYEPFEHVGVVGEWTCSSDGRVALAVRTRPDLAAGLGEVGELLAGPAAFRLEHLVSADLLREPVLEQQRVKGWATLTVAALRQTALAHRACPDCSGTGTCAADGCGCLAQGACAICSGYGVLPLRNEFRLKPEEEVWLRLRLVQTGLVHGTLPPQRMLLNRELLWLCLPPDAPEDESVSVGIRTRPDDGMLILLGADWRAMVGGIRPGRHSDMRAQLLDLVEAPAAPVEVRS